MESRIGILLAALGVFLGASLGSNFSAFIDLPPLLFVLRVGFGILLSSQGWEAFFGLVTGPFSVKTCSVEQNRSVATTGISAFVAAGWIGLLIGVVKLLSALDDTTRIGNRRCVVDLVRLHHRLGYFCLPLSKICCACSCLTLRNFESQ